MNYKILLLGLFFSFHISSIQAEGTNAQIVGFIKDQSGKGVEFASVALYKSKDSSLVTGVSANDRGYYEIGNIKQGSYYLIASNIGFKKTVSSIIHIEKETNEIKMDLVLYPEHVQMDEVQIKAQRPVIRQEAGVTVVSVENSPMNSGLSVIEAMKRVPGVSVDKDGGLKLKGKDGVLVMLDGKPLYMDAAQIGNLLKSLPADQVKEIEVLTSPSASYDAAGNAGIINIKLKKGAYEGWDGTGTASYGHGVYPKANAGINLSYKKDRLSITGGYQYNYKKNLQRFYIDRKYYNKRDSSFFTNSDYAEPANTHNALLNGSYDVGKRGTFSWDANGMYESSKWRGLSDSYLYSQLGDTLSHFNTVDDSKGSSYNINSGIGYKQKLDTVGTELSGNVEYKTMQRNSHQTFVTNFYDPTGVQTAPPFSYVSNIPIRLEQSSAKVDFVKVLPKDLKVEVGLKYNHIETNSRISSTITPINNFTYKESIEAAYVVLNKKFDKWKFQGGLRVENTHNQGIQESIDSTYNRQYTNFFPSANISYKPSEKTEYTLLYSSRIQRPSYESLNPFSYYNDPYNKFSGNPYLVPQYTNHVEFSFSNWQGAFMTTANYTHMRSPQADVWIIDPNSLVTTYSSRNLKSQENFGLSLSLNMSPVKWWTMANYVLFYYNSLRGNIGYGEVTVNRFAYMINATHTFTLPWSMSAELSGNYEAPHYYGTVLYRELWQLSAGIQRKMLKEKLTVKLAVTDVFWKYVYLGDGTFGNTHTTDMYKWDNRVGMLTVSYRFGHKFTPGVNAKGTDYEQNMRR